MRDSKYIEGIHPSQLSKKMNKNELTLDQLSEVNGGAIFVKFDGFKSGTHFDQKSNQVSLLSTSFKQGRNVSWLQKQQQT